MNTRNYFFYIIKVICDEIGKPELMESIPRPPTQSTIRRRNLLTQSEIAALLRASRDLYERAIIEVLVESGCRIGLIEALESLSSFD